MPSTNDILRKLQDLTAVKTDAAKVSQGHKVYERYCAGCHGTGAVGGGVVPDLRYSPTVKSHQSFYSIVGEGVLAERGMVGFSDELSAEQIDAMRHFIIARNQFAHSIGDTTRLSR